MSERPNIVVVMTDDHGPWAMGCAGNQELRTPTMDWMAATGVRFPEAYTPCPVCSPARASFFTGLYPSQHGIADWLDGSYGDQSLLAGFRMLPQRLKSVGYRTGLVGKWHCGGDRVRQEGFDTWFSHVDGQYPHAGRIEMTDGETRFELEGQQSEILTERALRFIDDEDEDGSPLFLFAGFVDTHSPFVDQPEPLVEHHRGSDFADIPDENSRLTEGWIRMGRPDDEAIHREWLAQYYAAVETIDRQLKRIVDRLEDKGLLENTVVIYTSDHGHMNGHHGLCTKGNATVPVCFFDEAIQVPLLWRHGEGHGHERFGPVSHCDLFASLLEVAGLPLEGYAGPGMSLVDQDLAVRDDERSDRAGICEYGPSRMIRKGGLKLIEHGSYASGQYGNQLFNLERDPRETLNLYHDDAYRTRRDALAVELHAFFEGLRRCDPIGGPTSRTEIGCNDSVPWRSFRPEPTPAQGTDIEAVAGY